MKPVVRPFDFVRQPGKWKFRLTTDLVIDFPGHDFGNHIFLDQRGTCRSLAGGDCWVITAGYAWDGASMVPDFPETIAASCWHDSAGQFRHLECLKKNLSGGQWNKFFADIIRAQGAPKIAAIYHFGLVIGNPFYQLAGRLFGAKPEGSCTIS
jgi:hypothetical protein